MRARLLAAVAALLLLSGCDAVKRIYDMINVADEAETGYASELAPPDSAARPSEAGYGGELVLPMRLPATLNPVLNEDVTVDRILALIYEPLFVLNEKMKPVPNAAESYYLTNGGMGMVVRLRDDIFWDDGTPVTSRDVSFTIEELRRAPEGSIYKPNVAYITGYARTNEKEIRLDFSRRAALMEYALCFPLIPEHYYGGHMPASDPRNMKPVGNGPYRFVSYKNVTELKLTASETGFKREPFIGDVRVVITDGRETDAQAFENGVVSAVTADLSEQGKYGGKRKIAATGYISQYFEFIGFNYDNELFSSGGMRAAIARCVDAEHIVGDIYKGYAVKADTPVSPASWLYDPEARRYAYDPAEAGFVFEWHEFPENFDGICVLVNAENAERVKTAENLCERLNEAGLTARVEAAGFEEYLERVEAKAFDLVVAGALLSAAPEFDFLFRSGENFFSYGDETMDGLLTKISQAADEDELSAAASALEKFIADETVLIGLCFRKHALLTDAAIHGALTPTAENPYYNIHEWHIY